MDIEEFLDSFKWNDGKLLQTSNGSRLLVIAPYLNNRVRGMFFKYWKNYKEIIRNANVSCAPDNKKYISLKLWLPYSEGDNEIEIRQKGIDRFNNMFRNIYEEENSDGSFEDF